ncbi:hypothetical protein [Gloeothece verrucosa]|uniref:Uncharacterized protein n=1 Tax=Gloeothece verrucosa (strain PCC 7822) TaxID=497965 RepID=E0U6H0_GLOV7|nr:hypothetical protein [Gloeothece verrucosa]ADN13613.1 conserved hypothetical protein [Gloeothece verrucosa PCC 7822]
MASSTAFSSGQTGEDREVWISLKEAIAASSGFRRWQAEKMVSDVLLEPKDLDEQVYAYLKETLNTLAY